MPSDLCQSVLPSPVVLSFLTSLTVIFDLIVYTLPAAAAKSLQSCPTLRDPIDGLLPGSSVPGILQARTLEWVAFLLQCVTVKSESEVAQSHPTLSDPMDCSPPGSSVHGIFPDKSTGVGCQHIT